MRFLTMLALALSAVVALRLQGNEKTLDQGYAANHLPSHEHSTMRRLTAAMKASGHSSSSGTKGKDYTSKFGNHDSGGNSGFVPAPPPKKGGGAGPSKGTGGSQHRNPNKRGSKVISPNEAAGLGKRRKYKY
ncbi:hypothetical protein LEN26_015157 [Aphanomyces euteiches]|nr:hypothetical protein LEN26_015157 [Aphanomyces euteiches]KAH9108525.1 hypothetical protein AeMF1_016313 [Aphanomyces euteiches]KAH9162486.1 hypothetical protein AeNC1_018831 [Aphanomyces euteiches]